MSPLGQCGSCARVGQCGGFAHHLGNGRVVLWYHEHKHQGSCHRGEGMDGRRRRIDERYVDTRAGRE